MKEFFGALLLLLIFSACSKSGDTSAPVSPPPPIINPPGPDDIQITRVLRPYGYTGDNIEIDGKNFGSDPAALTAKINNIPASIKPLTLSAGASVSIIVPAKCGNGPITLTRNGKTATGPNFYYIPSTTVTTMYGAYDKAGFVNGSGTNMRFNNPTDFVFDKNNNLYVVERGGILGATPGSLIRKITAGTGALSTFSGGPLNGNTANYNVPWVTGLPSNVIAGVNGGNARFNLPSNMVISEDPNSNSFKLLVTQNNFVRIINEATLTSVFAGNPHDTTGGGSPPTGGRHEAHIFPLGPLVIYPNNADYGSPELYWVESGPSISKIDANGNISSVISLINNSPSYLTKSPDGNMYFLGIISGKPGFEKLTRTGTLTPYISFNDSVMNRATGKNESFGDNVENGGPVSISFDKDGNLFFFTSLSNYTELYKFYPDKSFVRLFHWAKKYTGKDGVNDNADVSGPKKFLVRDNGELWVIDGYAIRKMTFE